MSDHVYKAKLHTNARLVISIQPKQVQSFIQFLQSMNARVSHGVVTESTVTLAAMSPYVHRALEGQSDICSNSYSEASDVEVELYDADEELLTEGDIPECRPKVEGRARAKHRRTHMYDIVLVESSSNILPWKPLKIVLKHTGYSGSDSSSDEDKKGGGANSHRSKDKTYCTRLFHAQLRYDHQQGNTDSDSYDDVAHKELMEDASVEVHTD